MLISDGTIEAAHWARRFLPPDLAGVVGPAAIADKFLAEWRANKSAVVRLHSEMTFYTLDHVAPSFSQVANFVARR